MDFLKGQLDKIQQQLGGLNASQKMLTGSLVAIMVMTLLWWGRYAGTAEMEPVLPQSFSATEVGRVQAHFKAMGIPSKVDGDRVLVPADRRDEALASMALAELMPGDSVSGFDEISKHLNPWDPQTKTETLFKEGKQKTLQNVIRQMPGVKGATVLLEPVGTRRFGSKNEATASVMITMKDNSQGSRKLAEASAMLIAGAQQHLPARNVTVVIGGRTYPITGDRDSAPDSSALGEIVAGHERYFEEKVHGLYPYINGLHVKVSVTVNTMSSQIQNKVHDKIQQKETQTNSRNESEPVPSPGAAEPGASANMGASIDQVASSPIAGERTLDESDTSFEILADIKTEVTQKPAGDFNAISAAVRVPRSHFLKLYKTSSGSAAEPQLAALQPVVDAEAEKIRKEVIEIAGIADAERVVVSMYDDSPSPLLDAATVAPTGALSSSIGMYGKEIAIGALAVVSLFMISMMVRKSSPVPVIAQPAEARETPHLDSGVPLAGMVGEGDSMLDGMELDEDSVRTQQMLDQVSTLVGENPDAAANLVKRWLNRT